MKNNNEPHAEKTIRLSSLMRVTALVLCIIFISTIITFDKSDISTGSDGITPNYNVKKAMNTFPADKVMLSAGDLEITWAEFYFLLHEGIAQITYGYQTDVDWDELYSDDMTWSDVVIYYSTEQAKSSIVHKYGTQVMNTALTEEDYLDLEDTFGSMLEDAGSLRKLEESLLLDGFYSFDFFKEMITRFTLQQRMVDQLYDSIADISDDVIEAYAERNGYMQAQHILISFLSLNDGYTMEEIEDAKPEQLAHAEEILAQLKERENDDDFADFFASLMVEHSEDPGSFSFPNGYLFQAGDMVEPFSEACENLYPGEMSGIVETLFGYHIILRLPLDLENSVPIGAANAGQYYTLRDLAGFDELDAKYYEWYDAQDFKYSDELNSLDMSKLITWRR